MSRKIRDHACAWFDEFGRRGDAALLLFDMTAMAANMSTIVAFASRYGARVLLPVKSFPHPAVLDLARNLLDGFDVSNETELGLAAPRSDQWVVASGPAPWNGASEVTIAFLDGPSSSSERVPRRTPSFGLRLDRAALVSGLPPSRFGMRPTEAVSVLRSLSPSERRRFVGFQIHLGDEPTKVRDYVGAVRNMINIASQARVPLRCIDLGGGFRNWSFAELERMLERVRSCVPDDVDLILEPGYLLTRDAGFAAGRVLSSKMPRVVTTLSKAGHLRWSEPRLLPRARVRARDVLVVGPTCFEGDVVGVHSESARYLEVGQLVLFSNISGYCVAWNSSFNGWPCADVVMVPGR